MKRLLLAVASLCLVIAILIAPLHAVSFTGPYTAITGLHTPVPVIDKLFLASGLYWLLYHYPDTKTLNYVTSLDGQSWTTVTSSAQSADTIAIAVNGTQIFLTYYAGVASADVMFQTGNLGGNGVIQFQTAQLVSSPSDQSKGTALSLAVTTDNRALVVFRNATGTFGATSPSPYSTWTITLLQACNCSPSGAIAMTNKQAYVTYGVAGGSLTGNLWTGSAWAAQDTVTTTSNYRSVLFLATNGNLYDVLADRTSAQNIFLITRTGTTWGSPVTSLSSPGACGGAAWQAAYDPVANNFYLFLESSDLNHLIMYAANGLLFAQGTTTTVASGTFQCFVGADNGMMQTPSPQGLILIAWTAGLGPYTFLIEILNLATQGTPPPVNNPQTTPPTIFTPPITSNGMLQPAYAASFPVVSSLPFLQLYALIVIPLLGGYAVFYAYGYRFDPYRLRWVRRMKQFNPKPSRIRLR